MRTTDMHGRPVNAEDELKRCQNLMQMAIAHNMPSTAELYAVNVAHFTFLLNPELREV